MLVFGCVLGLKIVLSTGLDPWFFEYCLLFVIQESQIGESGKDLDSEAETFFKIYFNLEVLNNRLLTTFDMRTLLFDSFHHLPESILGWRLCLMTRCVASRFLPTTEPTDWIQDGVTEGSPPGSSGSSWDISSLPLASALPDIVSHSCSGWNYISEMIWPGQGWFY